MLTSVRLREKSGWRGIAMSLEESNWQAMIGGNSESDWLLDALVGGKRSGWLGLGVVVKRSLKSVLGTCCVFSA